jgi:tRNA pseudouridine38-40 synthase
MKIAACVEYSGTAYCGWQRQHHAPSVQEEVEKALSKIANEPIKIHCAGRTDTGVHGTGQVIHFETVVERNNRAWQMGGNTHLPYDITLRWVKPVAEDFHARFSALSRHYRYVILNRDTRSALLHQQVCWHKPVLDAEKMQIAAQALLGKHDFTSFRATSCQAPHPMRDVQKISIQREGKFIYIDIQANAFLHHMVRNIVGSLLVIGQGKQATDWLAYLLKQKDRTLAGSTASASGLYFIAVDYPEKFQLNIPAILPRFS